MSSLLSEIEVDRVYAAHYEEHEHDRDPSGSDGDLRRACRHAVAKAQHAADIVALREGLTDDRISAALSNCSEPNIYGPLCVRSVAVELLERGESRRVFTKADVELNVREAVQRFGPLLHAVREMRGHQRDWFGGDKSREKLNEARKAERKVDAMLKDLDAPEPTQGGLF